MGITFFLFLVPVQFTEQTYQPGTTVFGKCQASCNNGMNAILLKYCEVGGRGGEMPLQQPEYYFDANWFICCCFFRFFLSLFDGSMSFSYPFKGAILT